MAKKKVKPYKSVSSRKGKPVYFNTAEGHRPKNNKKIKLLDADQKGRRYAKELKVGCNVFTGEKLTKAQATLRMGYLNARNDNAKAYNFNKRKKLSNLTKKK